MTSERENRGYAFRDSSEINSMMQQRTASQHAGFLMPFLRRGSRLLDFGCGQGTITVDLAEAVSPGEVLGIDLQEDHLQQARALAAQRGIDNARFAVEDVYGPDLEPESFDFVYANAVLSHLADPDRALLVAFGLLKPGGIIALRDVGTQATITGSGAEAVHGQRDLMHAAIDATTKSPYGARIGPTMNHLCRIAGFEVLRVSATYEIRTPFQYPAPIQEAGGVLVGPLRQNLLRFGIATEQEMDELLTRTKEQWMPDPDAFYAESWFEVVARRP